MISGRGGLCKRLRCCGFGDRNIPGSARSCTGEDSVEETGSALPSFSILCTFTSRARTKVSMSSKLRDMSPPGPGKLMGNGSAMCSEAGERNLTVGDETTAADEWGGRVAWEAVGLGASRRGKVTLFCDCNTANLEAGLEWAWVCAEAAAGQAGAVRSPG